MSFKEKAVGSVIKGVVESVTKEYPVMGNFILSIVAIGFGVGTHYFHSEHKQALNKAETEVTMAGLKAEVTVVKAEVSAVKAEAFVAREESRALRGELDKLKEKNMQLEKVMYKYQVDTENKFTSISFDAEKRFLEWNKDQFKLIADSLNKIFQKESRKDSQ